MIAHAYHTCQVDEDDKAHEGIEVIPLVVGVLQAKEEVRVGVDDEQVQ